mgnify:CR=1 FL=1
MCSKNVHCLLRKKYKYVDFFIKTDKETRGKWKGVEENKSNQSITNKEKTSEETKKTIRKNTRKWPKKPR